MSRALALRVAAGVLAVGRIAIGAPLAVRPTIVTRRWIGPEEAGRRSAQALARGVGGRDLALGAGLLSAIALGRGAPAWLAAGSLADVSDVAGAILAGDALPTSGRRGTLALAGFSAAAGLALAVAWDD